MRQDCCVLSTIPEAEERSARIAERLALPLTNCPSDYSLQLGVSLHQIDLRTDGLSEKKPLKVDFNEPRYVARLKRATVNNELIAKACGLKGNSVSRIIDCTAGLGQDGYLLSHLGAQVTLLEQNPIVHCLLEDGLARLSSSGRSPELIHTKAQDWLAQLTDVVDVVMLDPMFPARQKSALVKKGMQRFHTLLGHQTDDADQLFDSAMQVLRRGGCNRIVVKRPPDAETLSSEVPHHSHTSKAARFDVYM